MSGARAVARKDLASNLPALIGAAGDRASLRLLKHRPAKLRINRSEVEIEPNKIRIVIEQIEKHSE